MSWRTVVVTKHCKLEQKMGYLICRSEATQKIHLSEITALIVESTAVSITAPLLCELIKNKIIVLFCDENHNPHSQLLPLNGSHDACKKLKMQVDWGENIRVEVWTQIVGNKIKQQADFLQELGSEQAELLYSYLENIENGDSTNREGHAAKVYFNALFGLKFTRSSSCGTNAALNYGYAILLSAFNRAICAGGYNTQIGVFHRNEFNQFNFSCDLMEPFRIIVDRLVFSFQIENFGTEHKRKLQDLLNIKVKICNRIYTLNDAINVYCKSVFDALNQRQISLLEFYELPLYENNGIFRFADRE